MFDTIFIKLRTGVATVALGAIAAVAPVGAFAGDNMITVVDIAGRSVEVKHGVERVILGSGRMMYTVAVLDGDSPFQRIIGWRDDLIRFDPDAFRKYEAKFKKYTDNLVNFGSPFAGDFSVEMAIEMKADLLLLNYSKLYAAQESGIIEKLDKAGIPVLFIDFRERPLQNTIPSLLILGQAFAREAKAMEFIGFYTEQMSRVRNVVGDLIAEERPVVFIERAAGIRGENDCCRTFGSSNYGRFVEEAGGINWGSTVLSAVAGDVSFEAVIDADPDWIIGTGANWKEARPDAWAVMLGYEATPEVAQEQLARLAGRDGFRQMSAVKNKNFASIYHQFYIGPYHFVAIQQFAKWLHPEKFEDLDPDATFKELHDRFLPIDHSGEFWVKLK